MHVYGSSGHSDSVCSVDRVHPLGVVGLVWDVSEVTEELGEVDDTSVSDAYPLCQTVELRLTDRTIQHDHQDTT